MRILMIIPLPPPINGMSLANKMLREGLEEAGHEIVVVDTMPERVMQKFSDQGKLKISKIFASIGPLFKGCFSILFERGWDAVYITPAQSEWGYLKYTPFIFSAAVKRIPAFIHIHGGYFRKMYDASTGWRRSLIRKSLCLLAGAIVLGPSLRHMFEGLIPDGKIFVCPNAVEDEIFATKEEIEDKIYRWERDDILRIVYLSNLMRSKGILDLLEAVKGLKKEGGKVHLDVAGAIEPEIETDVRQYFSELGEVVTYHGVVQGQQKKDLLLRNYIFCLPTYYPNEGQPISILEAMANGCFILTTNIGGIKDIIDNDYGLFVENEDLLDRLLGLKLGPRCFRFSCHSANALYQKESFVLRISNILKLDECR